MCLVIFVANFIDIVSHVGIFLCVRTATMPLTYYAKAVQNRIRMNDFQKAIWSTTFSHKLNWMVGKNTMNCLNKNIFVEPNNFATTFSYNNLTQHTTRKLKFCSCLMQWNAKVLKCKTRTHTHTWISWLFKLNPLKSICCCYCYFLTIHAYLYGVWMVHVFIGAGLKYLVV